MIVQNVSGLLAGLIFGFGLAASGMTDTTKVLGFLDVFGAWDVDLLFVMASAIVITSIGYKLVLLRKQPLYAPSFYVPTNKIIDRKLILGAMIFGVGWGLYGFCPGPAVAALAYFQPATVLFILAMLAGLGIGARLAKIV